MSSAKILRLGAVVEIIGGISERQYDHAIETKVHQQKLRLQDSIVEPMIICCIDASAFSFRLDALYHEIAQYSCSRNLIYFMRKSLNAKIRG